jgi:SsrA-binding protein
MHRDPQNRTIATNRKAHHRFEILQRWEAGLVLQGSEVKSLRQGGASIEEGYARVHEGRADLHGMHIPPYAHAGYAGHDPDRPKRLLLHKRQLSDLEPQAGQKGYTLVPLRLYFLKGRAKVEIALARGRSKTDKRHAIREKEAKREILRAKHKRG